MYIELRLEQCIDIVKSVKTLILQKKKRINIFQKLNRLYKNILNIIYINTGFQFFNKSANFKNDIQKYKK